MNVVVLTPSREPRECCETGPVIRRERKNLKQRIRLMCFVCGDHGLWARSVTRAIRNWNDMYKSRYLSTSTDDMYHKSTCV